MPRAPLLSLFAALAALAACGDDHAARDPFDAAPAPDAPSPELPDAAPTPDAAPPTTATRFAVAVIPDTQYLFDQDRGDPEALAASLRWIVAHRADLNIAFVAGLGDVVENAGDGELAAASDVYRILDDAGMPYSVVAGNHDLRNQRADDTRTGEPFLTHFGVERFASSPAWGGASPGGFNRYHLFEAAGRQWLLLALDWRPGEASLAWAEGVLAAHPGTPTIITTHEIAYDDGRGDGAIAHTAELSAHGQTLWNRLVRGHDQVFLTLNGHYWPPARTVLTNDRGHDVHVHVTNYQDRYYGGSGMIRLYQVDLAARTIDVSTFSPFVLAQPPAERNPLAALEAERLGPDDRFVIPFDPAARFGQVDPAPAPPVPAEQLIVPGTLAYWRFDSATSGPVSETEIAVRDLSGHGNDLQRVTLSGGRTESMVWTPEYHPRQPSRAALFFDGSKFDPAFGGAYLRTADGAPLNALALDQGYTVEAFVRLPADCCDAQHAWMGVVSRMGDGGDAGRTGDDPDEPVGTLTIAPGRTVQWAVYPVQGTGLRTSWSHEPPAMRWMHIAIVNDGRQSVMYLDGARVLRNPRADSVGISTVGRPWMVGATHYDNVVEQSFYGWIGDVRIVDHALPPSQWMIAR